MEQQEVNDLKCVAEEIKRLAIKIMQGTGSKYVSVQEIEGEIVIGYYLDLQAKTA